MAEVRRRGRPGREKAVAQKGAQALERGIAILQYLAGCGGSSSVSEIALNLDLPLSTSFRLLKVLESANFVNQDREHGGWHLGLGAFTVGSAYIHNQDVLSVAGSVMRRLVLMSGETVNIAIHNDNQAVLIGQQACNSMVRMCAPLGSRLPLHASGIGKALLYPLSAEEQVACIVASGLARFTAMTIVDLAILQKDLSLSWQRGYSTAQEEHIVGLSCIGSAIYDSAGAVVAAISISGPASRLTADRFASQGELVRQAAQDISTALGLKTVAG